MGKLFKINEKNLSYEEVVKAWEDCNNQRIEFQSEVFRLKKESEYHRKESEKFERMFKKIQMDKWNETGKHFKGQFKEEKEDDK